MNRFKGNYRRALVEAFPELQFAEYVSYPLFYSTLNFSSLGVVFSPSYPFCLCFPSLLLLYLASLTLSPPTAQLNIYYQGTQASLLLEGCKERSSILL